MSITQLLKDATIWFAWLGLILFIATILFFIFNWGGKFRLVGATIFSLLLSVSSWSFTESYRPPVNIEGAVYAPVVYDNGADLVVAQASKDFPNEAIEPTLRQIAGNLKGVGTNRSIVKVKIRKFYEINQGTSRPIIIGEAVKDIINNQTVKISVNNFDFEQESLPINNDT